ncbi:MAG: DNA (cytosine-5-)-methyltransferase [Chloroflexi bacterium]|nr:DNA (cytosine-5-)-methyltransferase [Chloroflexota bacterium]
MLKFIDLFAGLGGFHLALKSLGCECVFASEIDEELRELYRKNFGMLPVGDIRSVLVEEIPEHDILCAGFPCQPFSKAGSQKGFECPQWGDLFNNVTDILRHHSPKYFMLENVANLRKHNSGKTWEEMKRKLEDVGYKVCERKLSPHRFGIPQIRERMFIVGSRIGLEHFKWPAEYLSKVTAVRDILDNSPSQVRQISDQVHKNFEVWQEFLELYPTNEQLPSFPIWTMEFGATYPYEDTTPHAMSHKELQNYCGSHGLPLKGLGHTEIMSYLPSHARRKQEHFPGWKISYIRQNRDLYARNKSWVDGWLPKIKQFPPSLQKLEWNCKGERRYIWDFIIQIRASGVRVKRPVTSPSLVSMTTTQIPIVGWEKRYMTLSECLRLQSMEELKNLPPTQAQQIRAIGNAVNVHVAEQIACALIGRNENDTHASNRIDQH